MRKRNKALRDKTTGQIANVSNMSSDKGLKNLMSTMGTKTKPNLAIDASNEKIQKYISGNKYFKEVYPKLFN